MQLPWNRKKEKIRAVHESDLQTFLASLGLLDLMKAGEMKCEVCHCYVTLENFQLAYPMRTDIKVACDKPACYFAVLEILAQSGL